MVGYSNILTVAAVSVNNIGDNFLPTTAHTTTTANVDVNILPNIILVIVNVDVDVNILANITKVSGSCSWPPVSLSWITLTPWSAARSTSMPGHTYPCNT